MAFVPGITRYQKYKFAKEFFDKIAAGSLKAAIYTTTTSLDANTDPSVGGPVGGTAPTYGTLTGEMSAAGTGYTTGGYILTGAQIAPNGNGYQLDFADIVTSAGTIPAGTYGLAIFDITDSYRAIAFCTVTVTQGSSGGAMTFTIPANALAVN